MDWPKPLSTCERCRQRRVRCSKKNATDEACTNCNARGEICRFSLVRKRKVRQDRQRVSQPDAATSSQGGAVADICAPSPDASSSSSKDPTLRVPDPTDVGSTLIFQRQNKYITSCATAFYSENNLNALARKLGHDGTRRVLNELQSNAQTRMSASVDAIALMRNLDPAAVLKDFSAQARNEYIRLYFEEIHPVYPFLDRKEFEAVAFGPRLEETLRTNQPWAAIYYTLISLGVLSQDGGSFAPMKGPAWEIFAIVLKLFPDILFARKSLLVAQALTAMAIFAMNYSSWPVEELLITEAARIAVALQLNKQPFDEAQAAHRARLFWVIYCIEKEYSFNSTQSSVFNDADISCSLPEPVSKGGDDIDWLRIHIAFSKILSYTYTRLFSAGAMSYSTERYNAEFCRIRTDLQNWTESIPERYRPGLPIRAKYFTRPHLNFATLQTHFWYHTLQIAISRLLIHVYGGQHCDEVAESKKILMQAARSILEATQFVPLEASTPMNVIGMSPMVATIILFDLVVNNPAHMETKRNLVYLDVAAGYFQRLDLAVPGSPVGYLIAEFSTIAKDYVRQQRPNIRQQGPDHDDLETGPTCTAKAFQHTGVAPHLVNPAPSLESPGEMNETVVDVALNPPSVSLEEWGSVDFSSLNDPMLYSIEKLSNDFNIPDVFGQPFFFDVHSTNAG